MRFAFLKIESFKRGIAFSSAFNFVAKFLVFLQSVVIAYYFGTQSKTDVFFYCFTTISLIAVFVNTLDSSVLIPEAMRLREQESNEASIRFLNFFIYGYIFIGASVSTILFLFPVPSFALLSKFDIDTLQRNKEVLLFSIPLLLLMITTNLLVNILTSYRFFTMPMIVGVINGTLVLLSLFLFHSSFEMSSVLIGQIVAYVVNISFLIYLMRKNLHWNFSFEMIKLEKRVLKNVFYAQAGNITSALSAYIPVYLLSGLGQGIVTSLIYGQKTAEIPNQLVTSQVSSVTGIRLNELHAKSDFENFNRVFLMSVNTLLFVLIPFSALMFLFSEDIMTLFFKRGAFDAASIAQSVIFFKYFAPMLPLLAVNTMVARLFMATQKIAYSFLYQIVFNVILILLVIGGIKLFGPIGYPYTLVSVYLINVFSGHWLLRSFFPWLSYSRIYPTFLKILGINLIAISMTLALQTLITDFNKLVSLVTGCSVYVAIILITNLYTGFNAEVNHVLKKGRLLLTSIFADKKN